MKETPVSSALDEKAVQERVQEWLANYRPIQQRLDIEVLEVYVANRISEIRGMRAQKRLDRSTMLMIEKLIQRNETWRTAYQNLLGAAALAKKSGS